MESCIIKKEQVGKITLIMYKHPLRTGVYCVLPKQTAIPPYIGTYRECVRAFNSAKRHLAEDEQD